MCRLADTGTRLHLPDLSPPSAPTRYDTDAATVHAADQFLDARARRFNNGQQPYGLVIRRLAIHHRLPGQSKP